MSQWITIFIEDSFDSAHSLPRVPKGHKCRNLHGHTYKIRISLEGKINPQSGWLVDYADVKLVWGSVKQILDHHNLNEIEGLENSTCENLANYIWSKLALTPIKMFLKRIELRETEHCGVVLEK